MKPITVDISATVDLIEIIEDLGQDEREEFLEEADLIEKGSELVYVVDCIPESNSFEHPGKSPKGRYNANDMRNLLEVLNDKGWLPKWSLLEAWDNCQPGERIDMLSRCGGLTSGELRAAVESSDSSEREEFFNSYEEPATIPPSFDQVIAKLEDWKTTNPQTLALVLKSMGFKQETAL